jgi:hypothetical protein
VRKLATVRRIHSIDPIPGADAIEVATVGGWRVVVKRGEYTPGDLATYIEIDSWIPTALAPFLSRGREPRVYDGIAGERLRTVRLRGQLSQGLLLPYAVCGKICEEGEDVSELLGIVKYDPPVNAQLAGMAKGPFPGVITKTDQERCLSGDTLIDTEFGKLSIKQICDQKLSINVWSYDHTRGLELKPVVGHSIMTRKKNWVKITLKSGETLTVTGNHKIWCNDIQAYREAKDIIMGQQFIQKTD